MKIFVTGATGFIGRVLLECLLERTRAGDRVYALTRSALPFPHPQLETIRGSLADEACYAERLRACDYVFHLGALARFSGARDYELHNVRGTEALLSRLRGSAGLRCFVYVSSIGAVDRAPDDDCAAPLTQASTPAPRSRYGRSKLRAEELVRGAGVPFSIVRPCWVYGPGMRPDSHIRRFAAWVKHGSPLARIDFPGRVSVVHVRDLARALCNMLDNPRVLGRTYFAASEALSIGEIFAQLQVAVHGRRRAQLRLAGLGRALGRVHARVPMTLASLGANYLTADGTHFYRDCGIDAPIRFRDGVQDVVRDVQGLSGAYVVTGANSGIGLELARQLAAQGRELVLVDRDVAALGGFAQRHRVIQADLADPVRVEALAADLAQRRIACLINNAGIGFRRAFASMPIDELRSTLDVNVQGTVLLTRSLIDRLVYDRACIVNVASSVAYGPLPGMAIYAASKAFLVSWSEALAYELRETNRVVTFSPAGTRTAFQRSAGVAVARDGRGLLPPEQVAARLIAAIEGDVPSVVVGRDAQLLQFAARVLPRGMYLQLSGRLFERTR